MHAEAVAFRPQQGRKARFHTGAFARRQMLIQNLLDQPRRAVLSFTVLAN